MPASPRREATNKTVGRALFGLGFVIVAIQLLILFQLSRHTTVVDVRSTAGLHSAPSLHQGPIHQQKQQQSVNSTFGIKPNFSDGQHAQPLVDKRKPDGTFNGLPIYYNTDSTHSTVNCVGENYQKNAYMYRSCHFTHFCFDTDAKEYVLFQSPQEQEWVKYARNDSFIGTSTITTNMTVALGGLNPKWMAKAFTKLQWFPTVLPEKALSEGYYELPSNYVWVPFHSFAGFNAGHIIWDDFLPIYTLLEMFGMMDEAGLQPLLTRYVLKEKAMWATCDARNDNKETCALLFEKFLPAFGVNPASFSTTEDFEFKPNKPKVSKYVCASHGAAGLAMLTDHGVKAHGWEPTDYESTHNMGRGPVLYAFRNFMLRNLNIPSQPLISRTAPYNVVFSQYSTRSSRRQVGFEVQLEAIQKEFPANKFHVIGKVMKELSVYDQAKMASAAAVWVTSCGGGAVTATFLPRGASLIIYYDPRGSIVRNKPTHLPARLDWDLFNHMSYLRVHWLPTTDMDTPQGLKTLAELIRSELHVIEHQ